MSAWKAYYCNQYLTQEINNNIYNRHRGSKPLEPNLNARAVNTRVTMPIQDCRKPSSVPIVSYKTYNQHQQFNPGHDAPYNGYCSQIDTESILFNQIHPLQKAQQSVYVPSSKSDLFNHVHHKIHMGDNLAQKQDKFNLNNPNECNIGKAYWSNHTRQQTKNIQ